MCEEVLYTPEELKGSNSGDSGADCATKEIGVMKRCVIVYLVWSLVHWMLRGINLSVRMSALCRADLASVMLAI